MRVTRRQLRRLISESILTQQLIDNAYQRDKEVERPSRDDVESYLWSNVYFNDDVARAVTSGDVNLVSLQREIVQAMGWEWEEFKAATEAHTKRVESRIEGEIF
jgi:hypothetical protein